MSLDVPFTRQAEQANREVQGHTIASCVREIDRIRHENEDLKRENEALRTVNADLYAMIGMTPPSTIKMIELAEEQDGRLYWMG
jgi:hypothetical protein